MTAAPTDLTARLDAMLAALAASPRVRVHRQKRRSLSKRSASLDAVVRDLAESDIALHPALQRCWLPFAEYAVHWESASAKDEVVGGEIMVSYLYDVASNETDLITADTPAAQQAVLRGLRVIDDQPQGGNGTLAGIRLIDGTLAPDTWFFDARRGLFALELNYCEYLDAMITTKGGYGWQYLFTEIDLTHRDNQNLQTELRRLLDFLSEAFPEDDYRELRERFAKRTSHRK